MQLVTNLFQILANVRILEAQRLGTQTGDSDTYLTLIKRGTCFLPYSTRGGLAFAPSRFIGYKRNSIAKHGANETRDGRLTNGAINGILGQQPVTDATLEAEYLRFCVRIGFTPSQTGTFGVRRKYWVPPDIRDRLDLIAEDLVMDNPALGATEKEQIIKARVGQGAFRQALVSHWKGLCCVTKCAVAPVLRASHIKPWRASTNGERLDRYNGLLLAANVDALFDCGFISFSDNGELLRSRRITIEALLSLGIDPKVRVKLSPRHTPFLAYHRAEIFGNRN